MSTINNITTEELEKLVQKMVTAKVGSVSVKSKVRELPKISIKSREELDLICSAAGHPLTAGMIVKYEELRKSKRDDNKMVGGYTSVTSPEVLGWGQQAVVFLKLAGLQGLTDLDGVEKTIAALDKKTEILKAGLEMVLDLKAGFNVIYTNMIQDEQKA